MVNSKYLSLPVLLLVVCLTSACSVRQMAIDNLGDALANGGSTFACDEDPQLIKESVPFSLKLIESLLAESPQHEGMLLAAARGFTQYSYAFVHQEADELELTDADKGSLEKKRAAKLYLRARNYGLRGLAVRHPGFEKALRGNTSGTMAVMTRADVPLLYWTAVSWGAAISLSKDNPDLVADQPLLQAMIDRALELEPSYDRGSIHSFLIAYEPSRIGAKEGAETRSRSHFEQVIRLSDGKLASPYVSLAETISLKNQNRKEFEELLNRALAVDPDILPESRLANLIAQRRARWLMSQVNDLFVEAIPEESSTPQP